MDAHIIEPPCLTEAIDSQVFVSGGLRSDGKMVSPPWRIVSSV
jgi:hypothetical protein